MKFKHLAVVTAIACPGALFAQKVTVSGSIDKLPDGEIAFIYNVGSESKVDTVRTIDGKFTWSTTMKEPQRVMIAFPQRYAEFYAQSGDIKITGTADSLHRLKISGSKFQDEYDAYQQSLKDITDQEDDLFKNWGKVSKEEQAKLEEKYAELRKAKRERADKYIAAHPNSPLSLHLVTERAQMGEYTNVRKAYDLLGDQVKAGEGGKRLAERLNVLKRSMIGEQMLDFTQNDTEGKPVRFADFRGKYVLVDFWASWCGPCRAENPNVLKAYNKYKNKNFTVLGVSLDDNAERWKKAIADDGLPWTQVSDLKGWKNEVSTYYGIMGIPSTLLVDPSGKIIAKDLRGEMLNKKLAELFGE